MANIAIPMAISAIAGEASIRGARAQAAGLGAQATMARTQARSEALKYKQQGVAILDNILRTSASINARAAAGGIDAKSGSAAALRQYAQAKGADEYYMSREGQTIVARQGELQAIEYEKQARSIVKQASTQAITSIAMAGFQGSLLGKAPTAQAPMMSATRPYTDIFGYGVA